MEYRREITNVFVILHLAVEDEKNDGDVIQRNTCFWPIDFFIFIWTLLAIQIL